MHKKVFRIICLLLIITVTASQALAASSVSISLKASDTSVNSGDSVTITVNASVDSCGSGGIEISFNSNIFQLVSGEWLLSNTFMSDFSTSSKDGVFAFESDKAISGNVFKFVLKVKNGASLGSSSVTATFTADNKSVSKTVSITVACSHSYSNSCDTSCNTCGATRSISHSWNSGSYTKKPTCTSTGTKVYTCTVCGTTKNETVSKADHTYDNSCDTSCNACGGTRSISHSYEWSIDGEGHVQKCSVCGETQNKGVHSLETTLSGDSTGHGYKCSVCGLIPSAEAHSFDNDCDTACNVCGHARTITHAYSDKAGYDTNFHWYECMICGEATEKTAHNAGDEATETTDQICLTCGYVIQKSENHVHTMAGDWLSNDVGHWYYCACLAFSDPEPHEQGEGVINEENNTISYQCSICDYVVTEDIIEETAPTETMPLPTEPQENTSSEITIYGIPLYLILAVGLGVSLIVNIVFIVCIAARKRGRFSK